MKNILFLFCVAFFAFSCTSNQEKTAAPAEKVAAVANKTITLVVEGMTCTGCENTIKEAVGGVSGVADVVASHTEGSAVIKFDSTLTDFKTISAAITDAGYVVKGETVPPSAN